MIEINGVGAPSRDGAACVASAELPRSDACQSGVDEAHDAGAPRGAHRGAREGLHDDHHELHRLLSPSATRSRPLRITSGRSPATSHMLSSMRRPSDHAPNLARTLNEMHVTEAVVNLIQVSIRINSDMNYFVRISR